MSREDADLVITGIPSLDADGSFIDSVVDRVLTNVDAEFSADNVRALRMVAKGLLYATAMADKCGRKLDMEMFVAFMVAAIEPKEPESVSATKRRQMADAAVELALVEQSAAERAEDAEFAAKGKGER